MISRRVLRAKVLQNLYSFFTKKDISIQESEKELYFSISKTYDLYIYLLLLSIEVKARAEKIIEIRKNKNIISEEDANPNTRFINNRVIAQIEDNENFIKFLNQKRMSWVEYPELVKKIYHTLIESDFYSEYMNSPEDNYQNDKELLLFLFSEVFYNCEELYTNLEEQSVFWNDDVDFVIQTIIGSIEHFKEAKTKIILTKKYRKSDDEEFVSKLLHKSIHRNKEIENIIREQIENWDYDRMGFLDKLILIMAITEVLEFKNIPVKASINEYIELAKKYGSTKSASFINGVLDKIVKYLQTEKMFEKEGQGLKES